MGRIVIKVWRGLVSEVYSSDMDTEVIVIDEDVPEEQELAAEIEMPEFKITIANRRGLISGLE